MISKTDTCNSRFLGACLGMGERRVQQLTNQGIIPCTKKGKANVYDLTTAVSAYCKYLADQAYARERDEKKDPAVRIKIARADKLELEVEELRGHMYRAEDVESIWNDHIMAMRGLLMALPGQLAQEVVTAESAAEAAEIIKTAVYRVLRTISEHEFDPEEYEARVRERAGWDAEIDAED